MIRLSKYPCVFIQIPRTGCGSINSIINQSGGHRTSKNLKEMLGNKWNELFKFAFVRHPFDRFASAYNYFKLDCDIETALKSNHQAFRPQTDYLTEKLDFIGRFENLKKDFKKVTDHLEITEILPHKNKSGGELLLDEKDKDILREFYKKDFELLNYEALDNHTSS